MSFGFPWQQFTTELALAGLALLMLVMDLFLRRPQKHWLAVVGLVGLALSLAPAFGVRITPALEPVVGRTYTPDMFLVFFRVFAILTGMMVLLTAWDYSEQLKAHRGEFFVFIVLAVLAVILVAGSTDLVLIFLFIEMVSLTFYILVAYLKKQPYSNEAAIKYLLYGATCSAVMLYGMSFLYGLSGSTNLYDIARSLQPGQSPLQWLAVLLVITGLGFKVSMVPFHQWTPDVYQGAPTPVTAFLSVGPKAAGFAALFRILTVGLGGAYSDWAGLLALLAVATMTLGNLTALWQSGMKRMLAYSTIAHAGYLLAGVVASHGRTFAPVYAVQMYLIAYLFMNVGAFAIVIWFARTTGTDSIGEFVGLSQRAPFYALALTVFLLSLTGIPPTAGFWGKYLLFLALLQSPYWWLALAMVVNTVISVGYYLNVVRLMYLRPPTRQEVFRPTTSVSWAIALALLATLLLGLYPDPVLTWLQGTQVLQMLA